MATDVQVAQVVVEVTQSRTPATVQVGQFVVEVVRQRITAPPDDAYMGTPMIG